MHALPIVLLGLAMKIPSTTAESCTKSDLIKEVPPGPVYTIGENIRVNLYHCFIHLDYVRPNSSETIPATNKTTTDITDRCLKFFFKKERLDIFFWTSERIRHSNGSESVVATSGGLKNPVAVTVKILNTKANTKSNNIYLQNEHWCNYNAEYCVVGDKNVVLFWIKPKPDLCLSLIRVPLSWNGIFKTDDWRRFISLNRTSGNKDEFALQLRHRRSLSCGDVWQTNVVDVYVSESILKGDFDPSPAEDVELKLQPLETVYSSLRFRCMIEKGGSLTSMGVYNREEMNNVFIYIYGLMVWLLLTLVFGVLNVVINYFTIRKVLYGHDNFGGTVLFYCLTSSLTNRYIHLTQRKEEVTATNNQCSVEDIEVGNRIANKNNVNEVDNASTAHPYSYIAGTYDLVDYFKFAKDIKLKPTPKVDKNVAYDYTYSNNLNRNN